MSEEENTQTDTETDSQSDRRTRSRDAESLLAQRKRLEEEYQSQYKKLITVVFTDLKDSTAIAEAEGDMATREIIITHNAILKPLIEQYDGTLVKTMGDGTMSYFESPQQALRSAAAIQHKLHHFNIDEDRKVPIRIRIGMHTGTGIVEENDIYGDVVNTAARFEQEADTNEIYLSESTYEALDDKGEFFCKYIKTVKLKGKKKEQRVYKAFWDEGNISEADMIAPNFSLADKVPFNIWPTFRLLLFFTVIVVGVFLTMKLSEYIAGRPDIDDTRSRQMKVPDKSG